MKEKLLMVLFVLILGAILTTSLVLVNSYTKPIIDKNEEVKLKSSVLDALEISYVIEAVEQTFADNVKVQEAGKGGYYLSVGGDIALPFEGSGLWGPITGILAMKPDLTEISGITIMHQEETPGLGSRIADEPYLAQFIDKQFTPELEMLPPGKGRGKNQIDSISGATMSSRAFLAILNSEHDRYRSLMGGSR